MKLIELNARDWDTREDFYEAFLTAAGSPTWHGHNLDALWDSVRSNDINELRAPFEVRIANAKEGKLVQFLLKVEGLFEEARAEGVEVTLILE